MKIDRFVSVVAPLRNDVDIVQDYVRETLDVLRAHYTNFELVLVDDDSTDGTVEAVSALLGEYEGIRLLRLSREFGEEIAIAAGLDTVIGDYTVVMLPYMDPPDEIPALVGNCIDGTDVVFGIRRTRGEEPWWMSRATALFYAYCHRTLHLDLPRNSTQFRCMSRQAVNAITQIKDSYRYLKLFSSYVGYSRAEYVYDPIQRGGRPRRRGFIESVNMALTIVMENSAHPLRFVSWLGLIAAFSNLLYVGYIFLVYFLKDDIAEGWATLSLQSAMEFFFVAVILAALCEYTGRVLNRLQDRPLYYLRGERNSNVLLIDRERRNVVDDSTDPDTRTDS